MQTTIYLVRHGEVNNPDGIIYGRLSNFGLTQNGKNQSEKTAEFLADKHIDAIYSSPLKRTKQTAEILQKKLDIPEIYYSDQILEVRTSYEGGKFSKLDKLQSEVYLKPLDPSDETLEQIAQRMMIFLHGVINKNEGKHVVIVTHGDPIMALKAKIKHGNKPIEFVSFKTDNYIQHAEIYEIISDNNQLSLKSVFNPIL
jgi:broad specificity phosphatase PhoE